MKPYIFKRVQLKSWETHQSLFDTFIIPLLQQKQFSSSKTNLTWGRAQGK